MSAAEILAPEVPQAAVPPPAIIPPRRIKAAYAVGQVAYSGGFEAAFGFIFFYYTAVLGMEGSLVGLALAVSLAFDAVVDPLVGSLSDGLRGRLGRRLPLMVAAVPLIAVSMTLLFAPVRGLGGWGLFVWLAASATATRTAISLFSVPHTALGAEMTDDYVERSRVVAWRTIVGIASHVTIITVAFSFFFTAPHGGLQYTAGYPPLGVFVALFIVVGTGLCCLGMRRYAAGLPRPQEKAGAMLRRLPGEVAEIFANRSFRVLFASAVGFYVAVGANAALGAHVNVYVWRLSPWMLQTLGYAVLAGVLAGVPLATPAAGIGRQEGAGDRRGLHVARRLDCPADPARHRPVPGLGLGRVLALGRPVGVRRNGHRLRRGRLPLDDGRRGRRARVPVRSPA